MASMPTSVSIQPCSGGKCLVAELDFELGEVVLEETPLLEMPDDSVLSFSATSHYEAAWLYSQHCLSKDSFGALLSLGLSEGAASSGKVEEVKKALTKVSHAEYEMALRFLIILMSNSFRFKGVNGPTTALFEIMSRVNHSCTPNVRMIGNGRPAQLVALRPIKKQEEVLLCYGGWETPFLKLPRIERRKRLLQHWGFHCECPRCEDDRNHMLKYCEDAKFNAAKDKDDKVQQPKAKT